ncbi:hypothetical protein CHS0354_023104 [Potamilus streckersoni]|uniref:Uncharacterized protein n=1 Tax=Potamilus streckersoni TaxID=2493646 RepID=A0AAE0TEK4_9BIVA|nr:hypothetical protein CHS0354_023104 [Potamilus streckersoni]
MNSRTEKKYVFVILILSSILLYETDYMLKRCSHDTCKMDNQMESVFAKSVHIDAPVQILDSKKKNELPNIKKTLFSGKRFREVPLNREFENEIYFVNDNKKNCKNWAVVTTIFKPSESVRYIADNPKWCLVVVADIQTQSRESYMSELGYIGDNVVFLEPTDHDILYPAISKALPWKHFGRKNIGYIYAIHHGGEYIWDFDDDNVGLIDSKMLTTKTNFSYLIPCSGFSKPMMNPYPYFGVNETYSWPRGFPLEEIRNPHVSPELCQSNASMTIGVIQSLANKQPDVDAIYRFTRNNPFDFKATLKNHQPLMIPKGVYTPFNAQATLWAKPAFLYLPLPISVDGRVTDIWRSYFAEYFFHREDIKLIFTPPYVRQDRNPHNILKDLDAENDLYMRSNVLINLLSELHNAEHSLNLRHLYDELYKRGYIELDDLIFVRAWVKTVEAIFKEMKATAFNK